MLINYIFGFLSLGFIYVHVHVEKHKVRINGSSSLPQKTQLLKCLKHLIRSLAFNSVTL